MATIPKSKPAQTKVVARPVAQVPQNRAFEPLLARPDILPPMMPALRTPARPVAVPRPVANNVRIPAQPQVRSVPTARINPMIGMDEQGLSQAPVQGFLDQMPEQAMIRNPAQGVRIPTQPVSMPAAMNRQNPMVAQEQFNPIDQPFPMPFPIEYKGGPAIRFEELPGFNPYDQPGGPTPRFPGGFDINDPGLFGGGQQGQGQTLPYGSPEGYNPYGSQQGQLTPQQAYNNYSNAVFGGNPNSVYTPNFNQGQQNSFNPNPNPGQQAPLNLSSTMGGQQAMQAGQQGLQAGQNLAQMGMQGMGASTGGKSAGRGGMNTSYGGGKSR